MIFWILYLLTLISTFYVGFNAPFSPLWNFLLAAAINFVGTVLSIGICAFFSLLLGKRDKFVLRKTQIYFVAFYTKDKLVLNDYKGGSFIIPRTDIAEVKTSEIELCPYVEVQYYNIGGWRKILLWDMYDNQIRFVLYMPVETEN
jgi:hypothetical protein